MDSLNTILNSGTYGENVSRHNDNYTKIQNKLLVLENTAINNRGYYNSMAELLGHVPFPLIGMIAYVYNVDRYYIANVVSGAWNLTATEAPPPSVNANGYYSKDDMSSLGIVKNKSEYKFFDDFSFNMGWADHPTFPLIKEHTILSGILKIDLTTSSNECLRLPITGFNLNENVTFKVRIKKTTKGSSKLAIGFNFGVAETHATYYYINATPEFQDFVFQAQPTTSSQASYLLIGVNSAFNFGDSYEIDYIKINEIVEEVYNDYSTVLGDLIDDISQSVSRGGNVLLKPNTYTLSIPLAIPSGSTIVGVKGKTVIKYVGTGSLITFDESIDGVTFKDVIFEGLSPKTPVAISASDVKSRTGIGDQNAVELTAYAKNVHFINCTFKNFTGCGIKTAQTHTGTYNHTMKITNCIFQNNWIGLFLSTRAEYHQFVGNSFNYNQIGAWIEGGNNFGSNNHFNANSVGVVVSGQTANNDTHGGISNSTINHNLSYSIFSIDMNNGYTFNGCHCFQGDIYIENSRGFVFNGGEIGAGIQSVLERSDGFNIISNNIFSKGYNGGLITGNPIKLSMFGNRFLDGSDSTSINNTI